MTPGEHVRVVQCDALLSGIEDELKRLAEEKLEENPVISDHYENAACDIARARRRLRGLM